MIKVLTEKETDAFIKLRMKGLEESPMAFGASFEDGIDREITFERLKKRSKDYFVLGYFINDGLVGIVGFIRHQKLKLKHKAFVWGMYVEPSFRGKGIAKKLMKELLKKAKRIEGLSKINISVTHPQEAAKQFYQKLGFEVYAVEKQSLNVDGQAIDEIFMELRF